MLFMEFMDFNGERYSTENREPKSSYEHWHRYIFAKNFVNGKNILDIACGEGYGAFFLADHASNVIGVDIDPEAIKYASKHYKKENLKYLQGDIAKLPIKLNNSIDVIVCFETIEHVDENAQLKFMLEAKRLLKKDGLLIISTPNKELYTDLQNYKNKHHIKEFYLSEFKNFLSNKFKNVKILGHKIFNSSNIWDPEHQARKFDEEKLELTDSGFRPSENKKEMMYFLALCSDVELPETQLSILTDISKGKNRKITQGHQFAEFFLDLGQGYSADHCIQRDIVGNETKLEFDLGKFDGIKSVRLDPLNDFVFIKLANIEVEDKNGSIRQILDWKTNAYGDVPIGNLIFNTDDPQIWGIDLSEIDKPRKISFHLRYLGLGPELIEALESLNNSKILVRILNDSIKNLESEKVKLSAKANEQEINLKYLNQEITDYKKRLDETILMLNQNHEKNAQLNLETAKKELRISELKALINDGHIEIAKLNERISQKQQYISKIETDSKNRIHELTESNYELNLSNYQNQLQIAQLNEKVSEKEDYIFKIKLELIQLKRFLEIVNIEINEKKSLISKIYRSMSWRITWPFRFVLKILVKIKNIFIDAYFGVLFLFKEGPKAFLLRFFWYLRGARLPQEIESKQLLARAKADRIQKSLSSRKDYIENSVRKNDSNYQGFTQNKIALVMHMFYWDLGEEFVSYLKNVPLPFDIYISTSPEGKPHLLKIFSDNFRTKIDVRAVENIGTDIAPFVCEFKDIYQNYDFVCKIHTKKSLHTPSYNSWRGYLLDNLVGSPEIVSNILNEFEADDKLGIIFPEMYQYIALTNRIDCWHDNWEICSELADRMGVKIHRHLNIEFPAGSMFWFRPKAMEPLLQLGLTINDFSEYRMDGTLGHAIERLFAVAPAKNRFKHKTVLYSQTLKEA